MRELTTPHPRPSPRPSPQPRLTGAPAAVPTTDSAPAPRHSDSEFDGLDLPDGHPLDDDTVPEELQELYQAIYDAIEEAGGELSGSSLGGAMGKAGLTQYYRDHLGITLRTVVEDMRDAGWDVDTRNGRKRNGRKQGWYAYTTGPLNFDDY